MAGVGWVLPFNIRPTLACAIPVLSAISRWLRLDFLYSLLSSTKTSSYDIVGNLYLLVILLTVY